MWGKQRILLLCITVFLISLCAGRVQNNNILNTKLNIDLYFESLCSDSRVFISNQLQLNWEHINDYANINFIPFGKSVSLDNGTKFRCQHGSAECKGNRIMSCGLSRLLDQSKQMTYVSCMMKTVRLGFDEFGEKCAQVTGLNFNELMENCYNTKEGTQLQLEAENATVKIRLTIPRFFVPTCVLNGVYDQQFQEECLRDFREVVCNLIGQDHPDVCRGGTVAPVDYIES